MSRTYVSASAIGSGGVYFADLVADARGRISGVGTGIGSSTVDGAPNEANWTGFQLVRVRNRR